MSVQSEINRISGNVTAALAAIAEKGVTVDSGSTSDDLATLITAIEAGSGGESEIISGSYTAAEDSGFFTIVHNCGKIPRAIVVELAGVHSQYDLHSYGTPLSCMYLDGKERYRTTYNSQGGSTNLRERNANLTASYFDPSRGERCLGNATENTVAFGSSSGTGTIKNGQTFYWMVIP